MPAKLNLLPRKVFEITLEDGTLIEGRYGTWSLKRFCDKKKMTLKQVQELKPEDYSIEYVVEMILCAVEYVSRMEGKPFSFTDVHACSWIDELGGLGSTDVANLFNHSGSEEQLQEPGEKKTEANKQPGERLSETSAAQAVQ